MGWWLGAVPEVMRGNTLQQLLGHPGNYKNAPCREQYSDVDRAAGDLYGKSCLGPMHQEHNNYNPHWKRTHRHGGISR